MATAASWLPAHLITSRHMAAGNGSFSSTATCCRLRWCTLCALRCSPEPLQILARILARVLLAPPPQVRRRPDGRMGLCRQRRSGGAAVRCISHCWSGRQPTLWRIALHASTQASDVHTTTPDTTPAATLSLPRRILRHLLPELPACPCADIPSTSIHILLYPASATAHATLD